MTLRPLVPPQVALSDGIVGLRLWRPADAPAIVAACQDPDIPRWTQVPEPYATEEADAWIALHESAILGGEEIPFAVVGPADEVLGSIGLRQPHEGVGDIGYWVAPWARRRRVATRAVGLLSDWALSDLSLFRLQIKVEPGNLASQGVAERAGYRREGLLRSYEVIKGRPRDVIIYSRLPAGPG